MANFQSIWANRNDIVEELEKLRIDAEKNAECEKESAIRVQRLFRGQVVRARVSTMKSGEQMIAGCEELAIFHYHACLIQRTFRGFYSRRYFHDYSARKKYIADIIEKGQTVRQKLEENLQKQKEAEWEEKQRKTEAEFQKVTQNLHHLVSTKVQSGIYNSPYDEVPTAYGKPVEDHLRTGVRDLLRTRTLDRTLAKKHKKGKNLNGTRLVPIKPPATRLTLQASSNYNLPKEQAEMDRKLNKLQWVGNPQGFLAGQRVKDKGYERGISDKSPYVDPWKNPYRKRGIPKNQEEMQGVRTSLERHPEVPFYTRVGGNKSTVHANDTFDTIHEAEFTGGAVGRHKGRTLRFGVPDTADVRETSQLYMYPSPPNNKMKVNTLTSRSR
eukprot:CAMPEP_0117778062 /NCGR_PEP_ID=MMETSP0948-20121206/758_1 /TAXON_ID=44440 /ORGANISM="Chattonella subsalsa, Strain CCMP2191" /LENGTH=383 /DNA_ID=CAMNT_0005605293 /DNA_START=135 /DNA_END=1287 /DNA_ORIENTATION=-